MKQQKDIVLNLQKLIQQLELSRQWLDRSYNLCLQAGIKQSYEPEELDSFENLASRFARSCDLLVSKIFRSIDHVEFASEGTLLDALNRAEKRGLIDSIDQIRTLRELRNEIVHEYLPSEITKLFQDLMHNAPVLTGLINRTIHYCANIKS